jgi:Transglutaminase-like superfamily
MRRLLLLVLLGCLASPVAGDEALIRLPTALAARVEVGARGKMFVGLEADSRGSFATVSQSVRPLVAAPAYPLADAERCPLAGALATPPDFQPPEALRNLARGSTTATDVVQGVVAFVSQNIRLDEEDGADQDAAAVLRRRKARCSGRANLAVGLLRSLGLPARVVHGLVVDEAGARWHRWGEVWLGPLGWLPFDPGASVGVVSVRYLPFSRVIAGLPLAGVRLLSVEERGFLALPVRDGLRVLPDRGLTLRCLLPSMQELTAVLQGPGGQRWAQRSRGEVVFHDILPGRYRLTWEVEGRMTAPPAIEVRGQGELHVELATAPGALT